MSVHRFSGRGPARRVRAALAAIVFLAIMPFARAGVSVGGLQVEYRSNPLGIDVATPHFSWQMMADGHARGVSQTAYRILVQDSSGHTAWDTGEIHDTHSLDIPYGGTPLAASTRYNWQVTVWDEHSQASSGEAWFETGLMNPDPHLTAWEGATWIGGSDRERVLYAPYFPLFNLQAAITIAPGSTRAGLVFAANDPRLMDKNKNLFGVQVKKDQSYFAVELDLTGLRAKGGAARLNVYRAGYTSTDVDTKPVQSFQIRTEVIDSRNAHAEHAILVHSEFGTISLQLDGKADFFVPAAKIENAKSLPGRPPVNGSRVTLNPAGVGHDYLTYGMLCDIGFAVPAGQQASFRALQVTNTREPGNVVFAEDLAKVPYDGIFIRRPAAKNVVAVRDGKYVVRGGKTGAFVVEDPSRNAMPMLRTSFTAGSQHVRSARLYITARGVYEAYLNGHRIGDDYYNPGLTQYNVTQLYQTYDVTDMVSAGPNALGIALGEGWWSGMLSFGNIWNHFGDRQSVLAKLVLTFEDGSRQVVTTNDRDWRYNDAGPIVYGSLYMGEVYDATREASVSGWSQPGFDDTRWLPAVAVPLEGTAFIGKYRDLFGKSHALAYDRLQILGQIGNTATVYRTLKAQSVREVRPGVYIYDMGQNIVGVPRIRIAEGETGQRMTVRVAEMLYPDLPESGSKVGMIMTENYRAALSQDIYIARAGDQVFEPHFTSHGFQYIELSGLQAPLPLEAVQALAISSVQQSTAQFESSNTAVNRLWSNLTWSNIDNFLSIPTDCPQRNERMGWSGDISVFSRTATYVSAADQFLTRHLRAMRDVQESNGRFTDIAPVGGGFGGVLWGSAGITVAWEAYQQYGDLGLLREHYPAMVSYADYLSTQVDPRTGVIRDAMLGDWLGPQNDQLGQAFLATAYYVYDLGVLAQAAEALGMEADAKQFRLRHDQQKDFFNRTFVGPDHRTLGLIGPAGMAGLSPDAPRQWKVADTQTSYAVGLALGTFSDENIPFARRYLAEAVTRENRDDSGAVRPPYSLMTGFIGTAWISEALSDSNRPDLAYRLLETRSYPSWLYSIDQGATTIWERLNGYTVEAGFGGNNSMNSFNHYSFGAVGQWLMAHSLGIARGVPGFKEFVLQPQVDPTGGLTWAKGSYESPYGRIESGWKVVGGVATYDAVIPANTTATVILQAPGVSAVREGGKPRSLR
jgi:alpha-L-rhamnosidase